MDKKLHIILFESMKAKLIYPKLKPWQQVAYDFIKDSPHQEKVLVIKSKRQVGKNFLANAILLNYCSYGLTNCLLEPTVPQARRAYNQMVKSLQGSGIIKSANASTLIIEFINGAEILYKSVGQQLAGFTISGVAIIDEMCYLDDSDIDVFLPTCDAQKANIVYISTPLFANGRFYEEFTTPEPNKLILDWNDWDTSEFLSKEKLEMYRNKLSPNKFKTEYLAQFITADGLLFTNLNECTGTPSNQDKIFIGIDWATGNNGDYTSIVGMNADREQVFIKRINNLSPMKQIDWLAEIVSKYNVVKILAEKNSIGAVFIDALQKKIKPRITNWVTTNKSKQDLVQYLQSCLENKTITILNDDKMLDELRKYQAEVNIKTNTVSYNAATGNDDDVIALMLACWAIKSNLGTYNLK